MRKSSLNSSSKYLLARGISAALALVFAFFYSRSIGVENRSILTFAMATTLIMAIFFTSGTTLTFRKKFPVSGSTDEISVVMSLIAVESGLAALAVLASTYIYSSLKVPLPNTLIFIIFIYSFFATLNLASIDAILAIGKFNVAAILEIITIGVQLSVYSTMRYFNVSSIAVSVFGSLLVSYLVCQTSCWMILFVENTGTFRIPFHTFLEFFKSTKHNHAFAISNGIVDRIDRIIIGWFLPLGLLGKFAVSTSLISYVRFVPDAISKLIISRRNSGRRSASIRTLVSIPALLILIMTITVVTSQLFIKLYLGVDWILPSLIPILFFLQEIARGVFQIECSRFMVAGMEASVAKRNLWMAGTAFPLSILGAYTGGLYGVTGALGINYVFHTFLLHELGRKR